eukprot:gene5725-5965_t
MPDVPLVAGPRSDQELANLRGSDPKQAWERIGSKNSPFSNSNQAPTVAKLFYDADDILAAICSPVLISKAEETTVVKVPTRLWLQSFFADIRPDKRQVGVDDVIHVWFREQQVQQAQKAAMSGSAMACRAVARMGVPASERPGVWAAALGIQAAMTTPTDAAPPTDAPLSTAPLSAPDAPVDGNDATVGSHDTKQLAYTRDQAVFQLLCESVEQQSLLTDVLVCAEVQHIASNEQYFVFEEMVRAILLAFSRDPDACHDAAVPASPRLAAEDGSELKPYPPNGVLPFQGSLASYVSPVCCVYKHPAAAYKVFVAMYCQFWSRLHTLNLLPAPAAGLAVLCHTFLDLLQEVDAEVYKHLSGLCSTPLDVAFPWIISAFVTHLSLGETLLLWDRIIGFDSLLPLPVLAVAVIMLRRDLILAAQSNDELVELLQDLSQLRVVPLLQAVLFDV